MEAIITYLENELKEVESHYDYYDDSISTKKIIESEKRQINRLLSVIKVLKALKA